MTPFEVGNNLETQQPFCLNVESVVTGRTYIASITRWGKSKTVRKILEACYGHTGIVLIDPEGEWPSLREKFPFLIIGKDVPLQLETAQTMAELVLARGLSVIIDTSMVEDEEESKQYVNAFLRRFFFLETTQKKSYLVVVEEAEDFVPERGISSQTCLGVFINIVKKGGKRGIGSLFIAHRPAWTNKGILSQCRNKAFSAIESTDFEAVEQVARVPANVVEKLPDLKPGQFYFVGDWVSQPEFVQVNQHTLTTHLGDSPGLKYTVPDAQGLAEVIKSLQANLKEVVEKVTPTLPNVDAIRKEAEDKANVKIEEKVKKEAQKIENHYKEQIALLESEKTNLNKRLELNAQQASVMGPAAPLSDVLEHPIVKNNLQKLADRDERAKNLLIKVHRDTEAKHYPTREELAAFVSASQDTVKRLVEIITEVFHAEAVVGQGRPVQYFSVLKRLYITDVARREIERIEELEAAKTNLTNRVSALQSTNQTINSELGNLRSLIKTHSPPEVVNALKSELSELREKCRQATPEMVQNLKADNENLKKRLVDALADNKELCSQFSVFATIFKKLRGSIDDADTSLSSYIEERKARQQTKAAPVVAPQPPPQPVPAPTPAPVQQPTAPSSEHQQILNFLKLHPNSEFPPFELSIALGLPEEVICKSPVSYPEIIVSTNGLSIRK